MKTVEVQRNKPSAPAEASLPAGAVADKWEEIFHADLAADMAVERRLFFREGWIVLILALLLVLREMIR